MSVNALNGFEDAGLSANHTASGSYSYDTTTVRSGTYSFRVNPTTTNVGSIRQSMAEIANAYFRFYFRIATAPAGVGTAEMFAQLLTTASVIIGELRLTNERKIEFYAGSTPTFIAAGTTVLALNTWYRIELREQVGSSQPYELKIDGITELSGTISPGSTNFGSFRLGKQADRDGQGVDFYFDDVVVDNSAFPGAGAIRRMPVTGNGGTMQWSAGTGASDYTQVDEVLASGADYVASAAAGDLALFALDSAANSGISGTINGVLYECQGREVTSGVSEFIPRIKSGAANLDGATSDIGTTNAFRSITAALNPDGNVAWTTTALDALEVGALDGAGGAVRLRLNWVHVSVDFTVAGATEKFRIPTTAANGTQRKLWVFSDTSLATLLVANVTVTAQGGYFEYEDPSGVEGQSYPAFLAAWGADSQANASGGPCWATVVT